MGACSIKKGTLKSINLQNNLSSEELASPTLIFSKRNDHTLDFNYVDEVIQQFNVINESYLKYYNHISNLDKVNQNSNSIIVQHILTRQIFIAEILDNNEKTNNCISLFSNLFHQNLQDSIEIYYNCQQYTIILNYCNGGSLQSFLQNQSKQISIYLVQKLLGQIFNVIHYLHSKSIVHGNLTLKSFEIVDQSQTIQLKLVDFFQTIISDKKSSQKLKYSSPQLVKAHLENQLIEPTFQDDVWSLGIIVVRIVFNNHFFTGNSFKDFLENIVQGKRNKLTFVQDKYYHEIQILLNQMLQIDPQKRINIDQILESFLIKSFNKIYKQRVMSPLLQPLQQILFYMMAEMYADHSLGYLLQLKNVKKITRFQLAILIKKKFKHIYNQSQSLFAVNKIFQEQSDLQYLELIIRFTDKKSLITKKNLLKAFYNFSNQQHFITINDVLPFFQEKEIQLRQAFLKLSQEKIDFPLFSLLMFDYLQSSY
ncbi:unnamed protein product [Paramecium sonneborni]|uniref:Protein kinase domain-containing protein n=1 Tax=Paramecium sonneborni TaxID=65129 RepID=A0A8S1RLG0_9CILI|nr:unnamed protein product [Paramecium sonneborni]